MSYLIRDLPNSEKPREKFLKYGAKNLSDAELIAIILRTGTSKVSVKDLAINISNKLNGLVNYESLTLNNLKEIKGVGEVKAITLLAAIELGRRTLKMTENRKFSITNASVVFEIYKYELKNLKQENLIVIFLDTKKQIISSKTMFIGTINKIIVHSREIFYEAIKNCSVYIIMIHNHPSGDPTPSKEDIEFTKEIIKVGELIKIPLIDHIIIGNNNYYSFYDNKNGERNEKNN